MKEENEAESAKPEWRDSTTYTKGKERIQDKALIMFDTFEILVHRCPDSTHFNSSWYMTCPKLGLTERCLFKTVLHAAQEEALKVVISIIGDLSMKMETMEEFLLDNGK